MIAEGIENECERRSECGSEERGNMPRHRKPLGPFADFAQTIDIRTWSGTMIQKKLLCSSHVMILH